MCSIVRVCPQCWQAVGGPRDNLIWDFVAWYGQFVIGLSQPPQLWSGAEISWVVLVLVSGDTDLYHV